jgi:hypothetical protein
MIASDTERDTDREREEDRDRDRLKEAVKEEDRYTEQKWSWRESDNTSKVDGAMARGPRERHHRDRET